MVTVTIEYDGDLEDPSENDGWKLYSFCSRHGSYKEPSQLNLGPELDPSTNRPEVLDKKLAKKLKVGLAFWLSYYEHGDCLWFLEGTYHPPDMQWDGNRNAGLLIWEQESDALGPKTLDERSKDAQQFLKTYTDWCNGHGYRYSIEDDDDGVPESTTGYYACDEEYMLKEIASELAGKEFVVVGDAAAHLEDRIRAMIAPAAKKKAKTT